MMTINMVRNTIDETDRKILQLIDLRISLCKKIKVEKRDKGIEDLRREEEVIGTLINNEYLNLSQQYIEMIYNVIFTITKEEMRNV